MNQQHDHGRQCGASPAAAALPAGARAGVRRAVYRIANMDCPTEESLIRSRLSGMPGIATLEFNLMQRELTVGHTLADTAPVLAALGQIGMAAVPVEAAAAGAEPAAQPPAAQRKWWLMGLAGASAVAAEAVAWGAGEESAPVVIALALLAIATGGLETYRKGWIALRNFNLNINALMSIAVTGAMLIGQWPEAAMVMFLFALAELIEQRSLDRARNAIRGLLDMAPETATVRHADGSWATRDAKSVAVGALARVAPGERVPLDGRVIAGQSSVNQAPITGESIPVDKGPGDPVFAGTINESGSFEFEVTAPAADTTLARIIHAVEQAQGSRAPTQRFIDRFARVYTPAVFAVALLAATVPPLLFDGLWVEWSYRALVLLVIACPCALVISTPVSIVSGLAAAARHGILVKGGAYLEESRSLAWLALDKTGTITHGRPAQTDFEPVNGADAGVARRLAASLAARSDHPVSKAVAEAARRDGVALAEVEDFAALPGRGVKGTMAGREYHFGNHRLVEELGLCSPALEARLAALEEQGKTTVLLVGDSRVEALFGVADTIRNSSRQAIAELHGLGVRTVMLSGDNEHTVRAIARQVGIDEVRANVLPVEKQEVVEKLLGSAGKVGMVGDGINDAPALARADIGIAMGAAGTDTAIETADVALMDDDLRKVPALVRLSRATAAVLKQNIALALGIKAVFLVLALAGEATMWMAVFADVGASLIVVANGLRLLRR
ncbi:MAG: heavy metal translocating P-type ATPase [Burkholderiales bacterium]|nr:heavy metal translocating P-type ATPase [Burkholderiales bacterium]